MSELAVDPAGVASSVALFSPLNIAHSQLPTRNGTQVVLFRRSFNFLRRPSHGVSLRDGMESKLTRSKSSGASPSSIDSGRPVIC